MEGQYSQVAILSPHPSVCVCVCLSICDYVDILLEQTAGESEVAPVV